MERRSGDPTCHRRRRESVRKPRPMFVLPHGSRRDGRRLRVRWCCWKRFGAGQGCRPESAHLHGVPTPQDFGFRFRKVLDHLGADFLHRQRLERHPRKRVVDGRKFPGWWLDFHRFQGAPIPRCCQWRRWRALGRLSGFERIHDDDSRVILTVAHVNEAHGGRGVRRGSGGRRRRIGGLGGACSRARLPPPVASARSPMPRRNHRASPATAWL